MPVNLAALPSSSTGQTVITQRIVYRDGENKDSR